MFENTTTLEVYNACALIWMQLIWNICLAHIRPMQYLKPKGSHPHPASSSTNPIYPIQSPWGNTTFFINFQLNPILGFATSWLFAFAFGPVIKQKKHPNSCAQAQVILKWKVSSPVWNISMATSNLHPQLTVVAKAENSPRRSLSAALRLVSVEINDRWQTLACICWGFTRRESLDGRPI